MNWRIWAALDQSMVHTQTFAQGPKRVYGELVGLGVIKEVLFPGHQEFVIGYEMARFLPRVASILARFAAPLASGVCWFWAEILLHYSIFPVCFRLGGVAPQQTVTHWRIQSLGRLSLGPQKLWRHSSSLLDA